MPNKEPSSSLFSHTEDKKKRKKRKSHPLVLLNYPPKNPPPTYPLPTPMAPTKPIPPLPLLMKKKSSQKKMVKKKSTEEDGEEAGISETESGQHIVAGKSKPNQPRKQKEEEEESDYEEVLGSESGSELSPGSPKSRAPKSKPISSKQIDGHPKSKTPEPKSRKRRAVAESNENGSKKRQNPGAGDKDEKVRAENEPRRWEQDDVITLLKGMIAFADRGLADASSDLTAFHRFINKSLNFKRTRRQLVYKISHMKYSYIQSKEVRNEKEQVFLKPHDKLVYQLSKKLWGNEPTVEDDDDDDMEMENANRVDALNTEEKGGGNVKWMTVRRADVIILLKGMMEFADRRPSDASFDLRRFHRFINRSLNFKVTRKQLRMKIWYMKSKYKIESKKEREGGDRVFSKPHEKLVYQLSKKLWGDDSTMEDDDDMEVENGNGVDTLNKEKKGSGTVKRLSTMEENGGRNVKRRRTNVEQKMKWKSPELMQKSTPESLGLGENNENDEVVCEEVESEAVLYPHLKQLLCSSRITGVSGLWESDVKRAFALMSPSQAKGLDQRWRKLQLNEREIHMERLSLVYEMTKECYELINSSKV